MCTNNDKMIRRRLEYNMIYINRNNRYLYNGNRALLSSTYGFHDVGIPITLQLLI